VLRWLTACTQWCGKPSTGIYDTRFSAAPLFGAELDFTALLPYIA